MAAGDDGRVDDGAVFAQEGGELRCEGALGPVALASDGEEARSLQVGGGGGVEDRHGAHEDGAVDQVGMEQRQRGDEIGTVGITDEDGTIEVELAGGLRTVGFR
jgi:hypothetical protein